MVVLTNFWDKEVAGRVFAISLTIPNFMIGQVQFIEDLMPTWDMLNAYKRGMMSEEAYTDRYRKLMQRRWGKVKAWLMSLSNDEDATLMCWCEKGRFCHRQLVARMIKTWRPDIEVEVR